MVVVGVQCVVANIGEVKMSFDRFDFEQQIMKCWQITDQLDTITEGVLEYGWNSDQVSNATIGLKQLYNLEFEKLFDMFNNGVHERMISNGVKWDV